MQIIRQSVFLLITLVYVCSCKDCPRSDPSAEGGFSVDFYEEPMNSEASGRIDRTLTILRTEPREDNPRRTALLADAGQSTVHLGFILPRPWVVSSQNGRQFRFAMYRASSRACASATYSGGDVAEAGLVAEDVIRAEDGHLVLLAAADVPTVKSGSVELAAELVGELVAEWVDVGCPNVGLREGEVLSPGIRCVDIRITTREGATVQAGIGKRSEFELDGRTYVVSVKRAYIRLDGACGQSSWTVYEKGFLAPTQQPEDGG
jgi:hypothetical protein